MSVPHSVQRLADDASTSQELRELLRAGDLAGPSEKDLARFAARMAPLVGLPLADLVPTSLPQGTAPADLGADGLGVAPTPADAAAPVGAAKVAGSIGLKAWIAAGVVSLGLGFLWVQQGHPASQAVEPVRSAPKLVAPAVPAQVPPVEVARSEATPEPIVPKAAETPAPTKRQATPAAARPDELSLIAQAQALRDQPRALLKVLKQHAAWYPNGMLAQEREVLAVEALLASGKIEAGKRRAARLEAEYPTSAHLPRVRALLEKAGRE